MCAVNQQKKEKFEWQTKTSRQKMLQPEEIAQIDGVDLVLARGSRDRVIEETMAAREEDALRGAGIAFRVVEYEGGHDIDPRTLMTLA